MQRNSEQNTLEWLYKAFRDGVIYKLFFQLFSNKWALYTSNIQGALSFKFIESLSMAGGSKVCIANKCYIFRFFVSPFGVSINV